MNWTVRVIQRSTESTYSAADLPVRRPASVREHVAAYKLGLPVDQRAAMSLLREQKARFGALNDEGVVLLAAAMRWGADRQHVADLHPGEAWMQSFSARLRRLPDSGMGHSFVLRDGRIAMAEDQALACSAAEAMAELAVGLVAINDSWHRRQWTQAQARRYDAVAKQLKHDFQVSFRHDDGTYAEALDELGAVVAANADAHAWWTVNGIASDGKGADPTMALARMIHGDGRDTHTAMAVLRLIHDMKIEPVVPDGTLHFRGQLPHGVRRVVVDGLEVQNATYRLSIEESRIGRSVHLDTSKGWATLMPFDESPRGVVASAVEPEVVLGRTIEVPAPRPGENSPVLSL